MIAGHQGYVLIQTDNYNIETSVTGLAIILIVAMVVLFAIEWLLRPSVSYRRAHPRLVCRP
ncbi:Porphyrin biosynthetic protein [Salmonella enterica subsp. enterica]|uniref:Porphyrin biosynthetic protein n=1 Tax=Salmonella enterica I TaxID=59201 RepID=A0A379X3I7_SALET|nr:Porphyrin biosynthetic protein [Salmonella enterica subsp. enterica]